MHGRNSSRKQISLAVNDVPLTGIQTVNNSITYYASVASDLVRNVSNNNNHPYGDNNLNVSCVLRESSEDEVKRYSDHLMVRSTMVIQFSQVS